jgi:hypothetical protein
MLASSSTKYSCRTCVDKTPLPLLSAADVRVEEYPTLYVRPS